MTERDLLFLTLTLFALIPLLGSSGNAVRKNGKNQPPKAGPPPAMRKK